jgi:transmembrane sensor
MDQHRHIRKLFQKYINNECTKEEFKELMALLESGNLDPSLEEPLLLLWQQAAENPMDHDVDYKRIYSKVTEKKTPTFWTSNLIKYAAAIAFIFLSTYILFRQQSDTKQLHSQLSYLNKHSTTAHSTLVILEDGTKVTLNANSDLRYPKTFNSNTREVYLKGEAYFQVVHNEKKPFIVHSGKLKTQVLGTSFVVSAYLKTLPLTVTVLTGKVAVEDQTSRSKAFLTRGQVATTHHHQKGFIITQATDPEESIAWIEDKLIFDNATLEETAYKLSNRYGVNIQIANKKLSEQRITAMFQKQSLTNILSALTRLTHTKFKKDTHKITIY